MEAQGALDELEVTYRLARATFGNRMGSTSGRPDLNPFQQALEGGGITSPDSGGGGDGGTTSAGESDSSGPPTGAESPPPPVDQPVPELPPDGGGVVDDPPLSFLITGATGQSSIGRASLSEDGAFVFEDDTEFHLFGGATFGFARPSLLLGERDQLVTADLNGDGRLDVVRTREQFLGTAVEVHFRSGNGFEFAAGGVFRFDSVSGLAVYDWDDDGSPELAVVTEARPNLHFYEIAGGELVYEREVTLRSKPAALIDSVSDSGERRLFLLSDDPRGVGSRYLTPRSGTVQLAWFPRGVQRFQLEGETAPEMTTLRQDNRLVLLRRDQGGALRLSGSLDVTVGVPLSVIGPHTSASRWELMYLP